MKQALFIAIPATIVIALAVLAWSVWDLESGVGSLEKGKNVTVASLGGGDAKPGIPVVGVNGDLFNPTSNDVVRAYDAILVSALVDPEYERGKWRIVEHNSLLTSFLRYVAEDPQAEPMLSMIWKRLNRLEDEAGRKGVCTASVTTDDKLRIRNGRDILYEHCRPFIVETPVDSVIRKRGIRHVAILPLFISRHSDYSEASRKKLAANVTRSVTSAVRDLARIPEVESVAIPALAGTEFRIDSFLFLTYRTSFHHILEGLKAAIPGTGFRNIYLVAWEGLSDPEASAALSGLVQAAFATKTGKVTGWAFAVTLAVVFFLNLFLRSGTSIGERIAKTWFRLLLFFSFNLAVYIGAPAITGNAAEWFWLNTGWMGFSAWIFLSAGVAALLGSALAASEAVDK
ncbi:MAG: hypothetical protein ACPGO3_00120 [Magnetospiraceae bacterium]